MFNFFKKKEKKAKQEDKKEVKEETEVDKVLLEQQKARKKLEENIAIHTMPKKFINDNKHAKRAKSTGLLIIVGGILFLIVISIVFYSFVFGSTQQTTDLAEESVEEDILTEELTDENTLDTEKEVATSTDIYEGILDDFASSTIESGATSTASSTLEIETEEEEATSTPSIFVEDTDEDGLSDLEEDILQTSSESSDTDGDGYDDLSELNNFYDPNGSGKLIDNENIDEYNNQTFNYSLLYPKDWLKSSVGGDDSIIIQSGADSFFQIIIQPNIDKVSVFDWYQNQIKMDYTDEQKVIKDNWEGLLSENGQVVYLTDTNQEYIFVLSYASNSGNEESYKNIFNMMINSFTTVNP